MGYYLHNSYDLLSELKEYGVKEACLNPKVSIIVPVYNSANFLSKCLMSLVRQTLKNIEIIIVNDGSTDSSLSIIELFEKHDKRFRVFTQDNQKQGAARNNGLKNAQGEYISFIDSDDWIDSTYCEMMYNSAIKFDADIVCSNMIKHKNSKQKYNVKYKFVKIATDTDSKVKLCCDKKQRFFYVMNRLYKKSFLLNNEIYFREKSFYEDVVFSAKAIFYANKIVSEPNVNYHYSYNRLSTINSKMSNQKKIDYIQAYMELQNFAYDNYIKLPERLNYCIHYWKTPLFKIYEGEYKKKISLFGIIPIFSIQEFKGLGKEDLR